MLQTICPAGHTVFKPGVLEGCKLKLHVQFCALKSGLAPKDCWDTLFLALMLERALHL